jgi:hypothetical protein
MGGRIWDKNKSRENKAIRIMRARVKIPLGYSLGNTKIREASSFT